MKKGEIRVVTLFKVALILTVVIAGFGQAVLQLWNWLMPGIFGLHTISFWQAVGLLALSWILFGGLRGFGMQGGRWKGGGRAGWADLSPEERDRFRRGTRGCGGRFAPPDVVPPA